MDNITILENAKNMERFKDELRQLNDLRDKIDSNGNIDNIPIIGLKINGVTILGDMVHKEHENILIKKIIDLKVELYQAAIDFYDEHIEQYSNPWDTERWKSKKAELYQNCNL